MPSGEVKDNARTVPRAILLALGAATILYLAIQYVAFGIMGPALAIIFGLYGLRALRQKSRAQRAHG